VFKLEFLQITLLPNQNWGRIQGLRRGDEQEGQGARGGGADLAGDDEHRGIGGAGMMGAGGAGSRGSRRRRGGTGAVGAEPHRDGVGRGTGRRRDAGSRDRSGRRRAGGRQGRGIVDVGDLLLAGVGKKPSKRNREERKPDGGGSARCRVGTGVGFGYGIAYFIPEY